MAQRLHQRPGHRNQSALTTNSCIKSQPNLPPLLPFYKAKAIDKEKGDEKKTGKENTILQAKRKKLHQPPKVQTPETNFPCATRTTVNDDHSKYLCRAQPHLPPVHPNPNQSSQILGATTTAQNPPFHSPERPSQPQLCLNPRPEPSEDRSSEADVPSHATSSRNKLHQNPRSTHLHWPDDCPQRRRALSHH